MPFAPSVILDLDGTLLDTSNRHYCVYKLIAKAFKIRQMTFETYWNLRRKGLSNKDILIQSGIRDEVLKDAELIWLGEIESLRMLKLDSIFYGVLEWLQKFNQKFDFILVTLRSNSENLKTQLSWLGIDNYFKQVLSVPHQTSSAKAKALEVQANVKQKIVSWIGDSEVDMQAASLLNIKPIGVTSGMRPKEMLLLAGAKKIYDKITEIEDL